MNCIILLLLLFVVEIPVATTIPVAVRMPAAPVAWKMRGAVKTETADR